MKKLFYSKLFFPLVIAITWLPAMYLHNIGVSDAVVVPLYLAPFAVFGVLWAASVLKNRK